MGFLVNLLTGGAGIAGANNAHLAELVIKRLTTSEKNRVAAKVVEMGMAAGGYRKTTEQFMDFFNDHERLCQLNVIALALAHLDIEPNVVRESWMLVNHPFALPTDNNDLQANASHFRRKHNLTVSVGTEKIDIREWAGLAPKNTNLLADPNLDIQELSSSSGTALQQTKVLAVQGNANEQYNLGVMYAYGQGVTQDYQEALKWFRLSAAQGNPEAQGDLGAMYQAGLGMPQSYAQAMMWYLIAKSGGTTLADQNLQQLESLSTPAQFAEAQRMALEWLVEHPQKNDIGPDADE